MKKINLKLKESLDARLDEKELTSLPKDTVIQLGSYDSVILSSPMLLQNQNFVQSILKEAKGNRVNFYGDFSEIPMGLTEPSSDTYSWFVFFGPKAELIVSPSSNGIVERETEILSASEKKQLSDFWKRDYIDGVLKNHSSSIKEDQVKSFAERCDEGIHYLYFHKDSLVGHACWVEDTHTILNVSCLYWHQWVESSLEESLRREIHTKFFARLLSQPKRAMSGVAAVNERAIRHCMRNKMKPVLFSIRRGGL